VVARMAEWSRLAVESFLLFGFFLATAILLRLAHRGRMGLGLGLVGTGFLLSGLKDLASYGSAAYGITQITAWTLFGAGSAVFLFEAVVAYGRWRWGARAAVVETERPTGGAFEARRTSR